MYMYKRKVLHRVLYPKAHKNGIQIKIKINVLSIPEVISSGIDGAGSVSCILLESVFRILVIAFIGSSTCPRMKT